jgi:PAS domain-containing protein
MLLKYNELARTVFEHSVDGLLVIDSEGIVRFANPAAVSLFSGRTKELTGFHLGSPAIDEAVEIALAGGDGLRHVEMRSTEIAWEGRPATLAALRDITERKRAEEELRKQADELRAQSRVSQFQLGGRRA